MPSQHKYSPIRIRPPEEDRIWLMEFAARTGRKVNAIVAEALAEYRKRRENTGTDEQEGKS